jgi:hypothetical protein
VAYYPTRKVTILALDPSVKDGGKLLRTQIEIPNEALNVGPRGYRVHVIDYDSTSNILYPPAVIPTGMNRDDDLPNDPFEKVTDDVLLRHPDFHAWMAYGIIMKTLYRFEFALGRRIGWAFAGHQIQVSPHAFADANAFYSDRAQGLFFGYFPSLDAKRMIFTCLSHEVVAHETTHALLDGLRERYTAPSSPQQAGFHEGFADIVALLSIFSAESVVAKLVDLGMPNVSATTIRRSDMTPEKLRSSALLGLAQEMGSELSGIHGHHDLLWLVPLDRHDQLFLQVDSLSFHLVQNSPGATLPPRNDYLTSSEFYEPHTCGEVLVAAVLNAYLDVWIKRLGTFAPGRARRHIANRSRSIRQMHRGGPKAARIGKDNLLVSRTIQSCRRRRFSLL